MDTAARSTDCPPRIIAPMRRRPDRRHASGWVRNAQHAECGAEWRRSIARSQCGVPGLADHRAFVSLRSRSSIDGATVVIVSAHRCGHGLLLQASAAHRGQAERSRRNSTGPVRRSDLDGSHRCRPAIVGRTDLKPGDVDVANLYDGFNILTADMAGGSGIFAARKAAPSWKAGFPRIAILGLCRSTPAAANYPPDGYTGSAFYGRRAGSSGARQASNGMKEPQVGITAAGGGPLAGSCCGASSAAHAERATLTTSLRPRAHAAAATRWCSSRRAAVHRPAALAYDRIQIGQMTKRFPRGSSRRGDNRPSMGPVRRRARLLAAAAEPYLNDARIKRRSLEAASPRRSAVRTACRDRRRGNRPSEFPPDARALRRVSLVEGPAASSGQVASASCAVMRRGGRISSDLGDSRSPGHQPAASPIPTRSARHLAHHDPLADVQARHRCAHRCGISAEFSIRTRHAARRPGSGNHSGMPSMTPSICSTAVGAVAHLTAGARAMAAGARFARSQPFLRHRRRSRDQAAPRHRLDDGLAGHHEAE